MYCGDLTNFKKCVSRIKKNKQNFKTIESGNIARIIIESGSEWIYFNKEKRPNPKALSLCKSVLKDVNKYLETNQIKLKKYAPINEVNKEVVKTKKEGEYFYAVDLCACYWEIAHKLNFIGDKTYNKGIEFKEERNMSLGALNKTVTITTYNNGERKQIIDKQPSSAVWNEILKNVEKMYSDLIDIIGMKNYLGWETDCLYTDCDKIKFQEIKKYFEDNNIRYNYYHCIFNTVTENKAEFTIFNRDCGQDKIFNI